MGRLARDASQGTRRRSSGVSTMSPHSSVLLVVVAISAASGAPFFSKAGASSGVRQPYKPRYGNMNSGPMGTQDIGLVLRKVLMAKKSLINKILAPVIGIKKSILETKKNLITPLLRPVLGMKKRKLLDSVGQMLGGMGMQSGYKMRGMMSYGKPSGMQGGSRMRMMGYGKPSGNMMRMTWSRR